MKKLSYLLIPLFLTSFDMNAQESYMARAKINYIFSHIRDTTNRQNIYTENMVLLLSPELSVYKSLDKEKQNALIKKQVAEQVSNQTGSATNIKINIGGNPASSTVYYQFANQKKLIRKEYLVNNYLIEEPLPVIPWNITNDTLTISGLKCQKATAAFKGRNYEAWFCQDIPFFSGPWKLNGLPGLIIQASDTKGEVIFKFNGFEEIKLSEVQTTPVQAEEIPAPGQPKVIITGIDVADSGPEYLLALPSKAIPTKEKEFLKLKEAMRKDPQGFVQSALAGSNIPMNGAPSNLRVKQNPASSDPSAKKGSVINNPIELSEK